MVEKYTINIKAIQFNSCDVRNKNVNRVECHVHDNVAKHRYKDYQSMT